MDRPSPRDVISRIAPPADLAPLVEALAGRSAEVARSAFPVFPTGRAELIFHFGDPFLIGAGASAMRPLPRAALLGPRHGVYWQSAGPRIDWLLVQLTPLGCRRLLGLRFAEAWESELALSDCWGSEAEALHERLHGAPGFSARAAAAVDALRMLARGAPASDPVSELVSLARGGRIRSVEAMARRLGTGPRRLHQRFSAEAGIAPKAFLGLMRFGRQLESRHPLPRRPDEDEYADDSHAIREFRRYAGMTPGAYAAQKRGGDRLVYTGAPLRLEPL